MDSIAKEEYAKYSPCIYKGIISCSGCDKYNDCDMRAGRELREQSYIAGWNRGTDILRAARNNDVCEVNIYSARVCKLGTKSCVLKHGD